MSGPGDRNASAKPLLISSRLLPVTKPSGNLERVTPSVTTVISCVPSLSGPRLARVPTLAGQPPQPGDALLGCPFAPRCPRAVERCRVEPPALAGAPLSQVACHFPLS